MAKPGMRCQSVFEIICMFEAWYSDGETKPDGGWLQPGETVVFDPNWHFACGDEFQKVKWAFIAVDSKGKSFFFEGLVEPDQVQFHKEKVKK